MNTYETHAHGMHRTFGPVSDFDDLPEPPDNFDEFNSLPDAHREKVANQFARGIENEAALVRVRVAEEYATARARQTERDKRQAAQNRNPRGRR